jgi:hypothetical protein
MNDQPSYTMGRGTLQIAIQADPTNEDSCGELRTIPTSGVKFLKQGQHEVVVFTTEDISEENLNLFLKRGGTISRLLYTSANPAGPALGFDLRAVIRGDHFEFKPNDEWQALVFAAQTRVYMESYVEGGMLRERPLPPPPAPPAAEVASEAQA